MEGTATWWPMGPNTALLAIHGASMLVTLVFSAFLFGAIFFSRNPDPALIRRLKISSAVAFVFLIILMVTGILPDTQFGNTALFSGTENEDFGTVVRTIDATGLGNFTGPILFDMMEHVSLIVPGLAAVIGFLIWTEGDRVITVPVVRRTVLSLMLVTAVWTAVLALIGVALTKELTFVTTG